MRAIFNILKRTAEEFAVENFLHEIVPKSKMALSFLKTGLNFEGHMN